MAGIPESRRSPAMVLLPSTRREGEIGVCGRSSLDDEEADREGAELVGVG